jgi:outer membrane lipoprotein-sorting protein
LPWRIPFIYNDREPIDDLKELEGEMDMKHRIFFLLTTFFLFAIFVPASPFNAQTIEEILEKMIEAQGGRTALQDITDTTKISYVEMVRMGLGGSLTTYQKEPNLLRTEARVQGRLVTQAFDGETAWMINPITGGEEEMPPPMAEGFARSAFGNDALLHPDKYGIVYSLEGEESVEEHDCYVVSQNYSDGFTITLFIDKETFLVSKTTNTAADGTGKESMMETLFTDYKKVESIILAHTIITFQDGKEFMKMEISEVKFNTGLEDAFFKMKEKQQHCAWHSLR